METFDVIRVFGITTELFLYLIEVVCAHSWYHTASYFQSTNYFFGGHGKIFASVNVSTFLIQQFSLLLPASSGQTEQELLAVETQAKREISHLPPGTE